MNLAKSKIIFPLVLAALFFIFLLLHDSSLYPRLNPLQTAELSFLRLALVAGPVVLGFLLLKISSRFFKTIIFIVWLLLIPYTIYSFTEIRHITELCHVPVGEYYTEVCVGKSWTLIPVFIYAFAGVLAFIYSVYQAASKITEKPAIRNCFVIFVCFYSAVSSVIGLYSRVNVWNIVVEPLSSLDAIQRVMRGPDFLFNIFVFAMFNIGIYHLFIKIFKPSFVQK